jgi:hypothetical protein
VPKDSVSGKHPVAMVFAHYAIRPWQFDFRMAMGLRLSQNGKGMTHMGALHPRIGRLS